AIVSALAKCVAVRAPLSTGAVRHRAETKTKREGCIRFRRKSDESLRTMRSDICAKPAHPSRGATRHNEDHVRPCDRAASRRSRSYFIQSAYIRDEEVGDGTLFTSCPRRL